MTTQAYRFVFYRWLLTPFKNNCHLTAVQIRYNEKHSGTRQVIERALGLLKGRWRRLKCLEMEAMEEIPSVVSAGCVLHNFCLLADEGDIEQFLMMTAMVMIWTVMINLTSLCPRLWQKEI